MCAPKNDLAKLAIIGAAAYASGGTSLFATSTATTGTVATKIVFMASGRFQTIESGL